MTVRLPDIIRQAMIAKGLTPNATTLAYTCGEPVMTVHRLFNGTTQHKALHKAAKIAGSLEMTLEDFMHVTRSLDPSMVADLINGRLKRLDKRPYAFRKEISLGGRDSGSYLHTTGGVAYGRLDIYHAISKALGIPLSELCETMLMQDCVDKSQLTGNLNKRSAVKFEFNTKLIA